MPLSTPLIIELKDMSDTSDAFGAFFFLLKNDEFPLEALTVLKQKITNAKRFHNAGKEEIINIAEEVIDEFGGTLIPYSLYVLKY